MTGYLADEPGKWISKVYMDLERWERIGRDEELAELEAMIVARKKYANVDKKLNAHVQAWRKRQR